MPHLNQNKIDYLQIKYAAIEKPENYDKDKLKVGAYIDPTISFIENYQDYLSTQPDDIKYVAKKIVDLVYELLGKSNFDLIHLKHILKKIDVGKEILKNIKIELSESIDQSIGDVELNAILFFEELFNKKEIEQFLLKVLKLDHDDALYVLPIFLKSKLLNKDVVMRLYRQYDPYNFAQKLYGKDNIPRDKFLNQKSFNVNDILKFVFVYVELSGTIKYKDLKNIISKASQGAQNTLRRFLWSTIKNGQYDSFFALDETMHPINYNSEPMQINDEEYIYYVRGEASDPKWQEFFNDYQIIPFDHTFKTAEFKYNKIINLAEYYYKLAQNTEEDYFYYQQDLDELLHNLDTSTDYIPQLFKFISDHDGYLHTQPNDITTILESLTELMAVLNMSDGINKFENLRTGIESFRSGNLILKSLKEMLLNDFKASTTNLGNIIKCESLFSKNEIENILKQVINLDKDQYNEYEIINYLILFSYSRYIKKEVINRLIRNINPYYHETNNETTLKSKDQVYKIDDVLRVIPNGLPYSSFKKMISVATQQAQDMMRRMLWMAWHSKNVGYTDFMLDETMQPIDVEGKPVHIEDDWTIEQAKEVSNSKWQQQFTDYQIVPFPQTFKTESSFKYLIEKYSSIKEKLGNDNKQQNFANGISYEENSRGKFWFLNGKRHREDGPATEWANGNKEWWLNGERHREDGPAVEYANGNKEWWFNNKLHREDGPAIESAAGDKFWFLNGQRHREDGPAIERVNGDKQWFLNDKLHREDGPAIEYANGDKIWFLNGKRHREDGPAVERVNGDKEWYLYDQLHREDGPAIDHANGIKSWYYYGEYKPEFRKETIPVIYKRENNKFLYHHIPVEIDWTNTVHGNVWIFDPETLEIDRLPTFREATKKKFPIARLEDIESGNI